MGDETVLNNSLNLRPRLVDVEYKQKLPVHKLTALLNGMENVLPANRNNFVFFAGMDGKKEISRIAFEAAFTAASQRETPVLFLNMCEPPKGVLQKLEMETAVTLDEFMLSGGGTVSPFISLRRGGLFYADLREYGQSMPIPALRALLEKLREQFGLIITYSGAALSDGSVMTLAGLADGTVLVAEAERTRNPVAKQLRETIESQNGKVVGAVLSRQRFYIPRMLYALLYRPGGK
jgi:hypothetical protein